MSAPWHRANPTLFENERNEVETAYPSLHFHIVSDAVFVRGTFPIALEKEVFDRYLIQLNLLRDYPKSIPIVREVGGRIPHTDNRHMNPADGTACVLLPDQRWEIWPPGSTLLHFLDGPVRNFFLGQSLVELGEPWPFGHWGHGADGIREYYAGLLGTDHVRTIAQFVEYLTKENVKGHWPCPCGNGKRLRDCHRDMVRDLSTKIDRQVAMESLMRLRERFKLA
jgi:hypothetical protein